jgi:hypothetical protein
MSISVIDLHSSAAEYPAYVFQATCVASTSSRSTLLRELETALTPDGWKRTSAQVFEKMIPVSTADLGAAEEAFLAAIRQVLDTVQPPISGYIRASFCSSQVVVQPAPSS